MIKPLILLLEIGASILLITQILIPLGSKDYKFFWLFREKDEPLESRATQILEEEEEIVHKKEETIKEMDNIINKHSNLKTKLEKNDEEPT